LPLGNETPLSSYYNELVESHSTGSSSSGHRSPLGDESELNRAICRYLEVHVGGFTSVSKLDIEIIKIIALASSVEPSRTSPVL